MCCRPAGPRRQLARRHLGKRVRILLDRYALPSIPAASHPPAQPACSLSAPISHSSSTPSRRHRSSPGNLLWSVLTVTGQAGTLTVPAASGSFTSAALRHRGSHHRRGRAPLRRHCAERHRRHHRPHLQRRPRPASTTPPPSPSTPMPSSPPTARPCRRSSAPATPPTRARIPAQAIAAHLHSPRPVRRRPVHACRCASTTCSGSLSPTSLRRSPPTAPISRSQAPAAAPPCTSATDSRLPHAHRSTRTSRHNIARASASPAWWPPGSSPSRSIARRACNTSPIPAPRPAEPTPHTSRRAPLRAASHTHPRPHRLARRLSRTSPWTLPASPRRSRPGLVRQSPAASSSPRRRRRHHTRHNDEVVQNLLLALQTYGLPYVPVPPRLLLPRPLRNRHAGQSRHAHLRPVAGYRAAYGKALPRFRLRPDAPGQGVAASQVIEIAQQVSGVIAVNLTALHLAGAAAGRRQHALRARTRNPANQPATPPQALRFCSSTRPRRQRRSVVMSTPTHPALPLLTASRRLPYPRPLQGGPLQALFAVLEEPVRHRRRTTSGNSTTISSSRPARPGSFPYLGDLIGYDTVYTAALATATAAPRSQTPSAIADAKARSSRWSRSPTMSPAAPPWQSKSSAASSPRSACATYAPTTTAPPTCAADATGTTTAVPFPASIAPSMSATSPRAAASRNRPTPHPSISRSTAPAAPTSPTSRFGCGAGRAFRHQRTRLSAR